MTVDYLRQPGDDLLYQSTMSLPLKISKSEAIDSTELAHGGR